jgi:hypothetical protein
MDSSNSNSPECCEKKVLGAPKNGQPMFCSQLSMCIAKLMHECAAGGRFTFVICRTWCPIQLLDMRDLMPSRNKLMIIMVTLVVDCKDLDILS